MAKRTNNDMQNTTQKTEDSALRNPLKTGGGLRCSGKVGVPATLVNGRFSMSITHTLKQM
jgi:hypothetical protein